MSQKEKTKKIPDSIKNHIGLLFELKIGLGAKNNIVLDYGGKPVGKIRDALKDYKYHGNLCAAIINHCNSVGKKLEEDIKKLLQTI